ncbi:hypothetical protein QBC43DRAFT_300809 [Cladorrhinum sp. PSN259]|nr:hypothetical protein QBC43DRAFT_300809 [Cladorrhinum sp. PSN259]
MAEVAGLVSTIATISTTAHLIISAAKFYIDCARGDCPRDLRRVLIETSSLQSTFQSIAFICKCSEDAREKQRLEAQILSPVKACGKVLKELISMFPPEVRNPSQFDQDSKRVKLKQFLHAAKYPFKKDSCEALLGQLQQYKGTIHLGLHNELRSQVTNIRDNVRVVKVVVQEVKSTVNTIQVKMDQSERNKVCTWLTKTDPSSNHSEARSLQESETCRWLPKSDEWKDWLAGTGKSRLLWLHGIPGAGKTVLASFMVEKIRAAVGTNKSQACSFYYCHHARNQDETIPFLGWVLSQLCRRAESVPAILFNYYQENSFPSTSQLLDCIEAVLSCFKGGRAYVVVDAVDESKPRTKLLEAIAYLGHNARFSKLSIAATSREYSDIQKALSNFSTSIAMSNPGVQADIRNYIKSRLQHDDFEAWDDSLKEEVANLLPVRARGMFRYASCQLEILRMCGSESEVRKSIARLPATLDETYDRILAAIPQQTRQAIIEAFGIILGQWKQGISSALLINTIKTANPKGCGFFSLKTLEQACGPLIRSSPAKSPKGQDTVSIAHYTVREYLESTRLRDHANASLRAFYLSEEKRLQVTALLYLRVASTFQGGKIDPNNIDEDECGDPKDVRLHALRCIFGTMNWTKEAMYASPDHISVLFPLLNPSTPQFSGLKQMSAGGDSSDPFNRGLFPWLVKFPGRPKSGSEQRAATLAMLLTLESPSVVHRFFKMHAESREHQKAVLISPLSGLLLPTRWAEYKKTGQMDPAPWSGSILDLYLEGAKRGYETSSIIQLLLSVFGKFYPDQSTDLLSLLSFHNHSLCSAKNFGVCAVTKSMSSDRKVRNTGTQYAPLQIACAAMDLPAVKMLLAKGADPNEIGDPNGAKAAVDVPKGFGFAGGLLTKPSTFAWNHRMSPLYIVVKGAEWIKTKENSWNSEIGAAYKEIKSLLEARGAKMSFENPSVPAVQATGQEKKPAAQAQSQAQNQGGTQSVEKKVVQGQGQGGTQGQEKKPVAQGQSQGQGHGVTPQTQGQGQGQDAKTAPQRQNTTQSQSQPQAQNQGGTQSVEKKVVQGQGQGGTQSVEKKPVAQGQGHGVTPQAQGQSQGEGAKTVPQRQNTTQPQSQSQVPVASHGNVPPHGKNVPVNNTQGQGQTSQTQSHTPVTGSTPPHGKNVPVNNTQGQGQTSQTQSQSQMPVSSNHPPHVKNVQTQAGTQTQTQGQGQGQPKPVVKTATGNNNNTSVPPVAGQEGKVAVPKINTTTTTDQGQAQQPSQRQPPPPPPPPVVRSGSVSTTQGGQQSQPSSSNN